MKQAPRAEELCDPRVRRALESYVSLVGGRVVMLDEHVAEFELPLEEAIFLNGEAGGRARRVVVAYALEGLEKYPDAEMAAVGSRLLERVTDAVRRRGFWMDHGVLAGCETTASQIPLQLDRVTIEDTAVQTTTRRVGRLHARLAISGGGELKERLETSAIFDLENGSVVEPSIRRQCLEGKASTSGSASGELQANKIAAFDVMAAELKKGVEATAEQMRRDVSKHLQVELERLSRYYAKLVEDGADVDAVQVEHDRRATEERRRAEVTVQTYPVQLETWTVPVEQVTWTLSNADGVTGEIVGTRAAFADAVWAIVCPVCKENIDTVTMCSDGHASCELCVDRCGVCAKDVCREHQAERCHVDPHPVCQKDAFVCPACGKSGCSAHVSTCSLTNHAVCSFCVAECQRCGSSVCQEHAVQIADTAPLGGRRLCINCIVHCEGGSGEPVGRDEAIECDSCERWVCTAHATKCDVDGEVHCSTHLRRTDGSRRLVCEKHRAACGKEPESVFAADELNKCTKCQQNVCSQHSGQCAIDDRWVCEDDLFRSKRSGRVVCADHASHCQYEDGAFAIDELFQCRLCEKTVCGQHSEVCVGHGDRFCMAHLAPLLDTNGDFGCEEHRRQCHVDDRTYSLAGVHVCPICSRSTCTRHFVKCESCARGVCTVDRSDGSRECRTCRQLEDVHDPDDDLIAASLVVNDGEPLTARSWLVGQDAGHRVVKLEIGWGRSIVFAVPHGSRKPASVVRHGLFSKRQDK